MAVARRRRAFVEPGGWAHPREARLGEPRVQLGVPVALREALLGHRRALQKGEAEHALRGRKPSARCAQRETCAAHAAHPLCALAQQVVKGAQRAQRGALLHHGARVVARRGGRHHGAGARAYK